MDNSSSFGNRNIIDQSSHTWILDAEEFSKNIDFYYEKLGKEKFMEAAIAILQTGVWYS